jgi:hypothetical protein
MNGGTSLRIVDKAHPVHVFAPAVPSSAAPPWLNLGSYNHVAFVISGVNAASGVTPVAVTVNQAQDVAGTGSKALPITQVWQDTDTGSGDTLTNQAVVSNTFTITSTVSKAFLYIIEIDAAELDTSNGFGTVQIGLANGAAQTLSVVAYMTGARVGGNYAHYPTALS